MTPVQDIDQAFWYILGLYIVLLLGITAVMVSVVVHHRRSKNPAASDIHDNYKLEIVWTVVPTLIALSMFAIGWFSYQGLRKVPVGATKIEVLAQQFSWIFVCDNDKKTENELVVPQGRAIKLNVSSLDVVHSFFLPVFRIKVDAIKGMPTYAGFQTDQVGSYDIQCAEDCGVDHLAMVAKLKIIPEKEFDIWLKKESD